jgi:Nucleotidyl transferase AbiEii toxin, Type IV TA system
LAIQSVNVSLGGYVYPLLFSPGMFESVPVADTRDIACMKVTAIMSRGSKPDFIDLYAVCQRFGLPEVLRLFRQKYAQVGYSTLHVIKWLTYFADAERDPMPPMLVPLDWREVKNFFEREAPRVR